MKEMGERQRGSESDSSNVLSEIRGVATSTSIESVTCDAIIKSESSSSSALTEIESVEMGSTTEPASEKSSTSG